MRIGIDCRTILNPLGGEPAGVGHYTYYLVKNLLDIDKENTYVLFFDNHFRRAEEFKIFPNTEIQPFPFYEYKQYLPLAYSQMLISAVLNQKKLDVFHSPANVVPLLYNRPSVVTVHDLAIYKYPKFFPKSWLSRQSFATKVLVPKTLAKAAKIIAVSKNTKCDIIEEFGIPEERIEVIYEGVLSHGKSCPHQSDWQTVKKRYGIGDKYVLFLGTIEPRKNIASLVKAFRNLYLAYDSPAKDYQLILAGAPGWQNQAVFEAIADANASIVGQKKRRSGSERRSGLDKRSAKERAKAGERRSGADRRCRQPVKYLGYVSHADKLCLIGHATCFAFPSLYEGFGLPVLEAMSMSTPVITSKISSLPEITGEDGAILIDPTREAEITEALSQILTDDGLRESLAIKGHERAQDFTWTKCAQKTLAVYQEVGQKK